MSIKIGVSLEKEFKVKEEDIASFLGSGKIRVLSTPSMIVFMENTARSIVDISLPNGKITVGVKVNVDHVAPAPLGAIIRVKAIIKKITGRRLTFEVYAFYKGKLIGKGVHERVIVDEEKFLKKLKS